MLSTFPSLPDLILPHLWQASEISLLGWYKWKSWKSAPLFLDYVVRIALFFKCRSKLAIKIWSEVGLHSVQNWLVFSISWTADISLNFPFFVLHFQKSLNESYISFKLVRILFSCSKKIFQLDKWNFWWRVGPASQTPYPIYHQTLNFP